MREHNWTHADLSDYLDGELSPRERVEQHVSICPHCTRVLHTLRRALESLMGLSPEAGAGIADGVIQRLRSEP